MNMSRSKQTFTKEEVCSLDRCNLLWWMHDGALLTVINCQWEHWSMHCPYLFRFRNHIFLLRISMLDRLYFDEGSKRTRWQTYGELPRIQPHVQARSGWNQWLTCTLARTSNWGGASNIKMIGLEHLFSGRILFFCVFELIFGSSTLIFCLNLFPVQEKAASIGAQESNVSGAVCCCRVVARADYVYFSSGLFFFPTPFILFFFCLVPM